jgi:tyrosyl-tRNA synthetase
VFDRLLSFDDSATGAIMVNNNDWLSELGYIDLLRHVGPHFTVNRMLTFDSVKLRLDREQPLTFLEFNYMILQAYDFRELALRTAAACSLAGRTSGATSSTASNWAAG